jgi:hypothetical protein
MCTHLINPMGIHLLCCTHNNECIRTHDAICDTFVDIVQIFGFHVGWKQLMCFLQSHSTPFIQKSTLCPPKMDLHQSWCCHCRPNMLIFTSLILHNLRICYLWCSSKQKKSCYNWHPINQFLMERFWHIICANLTSCNYYYYFFRVPLYIFQIYNVFINNFL